MTKQIHKLFRNIVFLLMTGCFFLLAQSTCISMDGTEKKEEKKVILSASFSTGSLSSTQESNETPLEISNGSTPYPKPPFRRRTSSHNLTEILSRRQSNERPNSLNKDKKDKKHKDTRTCKKILKENISGANSNSAILPVTPPEIAPTLKKIEALTSDEGERRYLAAAAYLIYSSASHYDAAKVVIYSYPLFTSEGCLFTLLTELKKTHPQQIIAFLTQLVLEGFPNGIDHFKAALVEFNALKNGLPLPPLLSNPFLDKYFVKPSELISPSSIGEVNSIKLKDISLANCEGDFLRDFANALAYENICLLSAITPEDMKNYLKDGEAPPETIAALGRHRDRIINWIAWQIVMQEDEEKRARLFQRTFFIGLSHKHNFCSATMIALALHKSVVKDLMSQKEKTNPNLVNLSELISPLKNNQKYRSVWAEFQKEGDCVPAFHILHQDAVTALGIFKSRLPDDYQSLADGLTGIAQIMESLSKCRTLSYSHLIKDGFKVIWEFDEVDEENLDKISSLRQKEILQKQPQIPKELEKWTCNHFSSFLTQHNISEKKILKIKKQGVCDGPTIIAYMGSPPQQSQREKLGKLGLKEKVVSAILSTNSSNVS